MRLCILENIKYGLFVNLAQNFHELFFLLCNKNKKNGAIGSCSVFAKERKLCSVIAIERVSILLSEKPENLKNTIGFVYFLYTETSCMSCGKGSTFCVS